MKTHTKRNNMNVYQKLNEARKRFHQSKLKKSGHNKFSNYYYFELGDFLVPAMDIFNEVGLCAIVSFDRELAQMDIVNVEKPEEIVTITSPLSSASLKGCHEVQNVGACETYARRYLWVAALEIVEHDALDSVTGSPAGEPDRSAIEAEIVQWKADMDGAENLDNLRAVTVAAIEWAKSSAGPKDLAALKAYGLKASSKFMKQQ